MRSYKLLSFFNQLWVNSVLLFIFYCFVGLIFGGLGVEVFLILQKFFYIILSLALILPCGLAALYLTQYKQINFYKNGKVELIRKFGLKTISFEQQDVLRWTLYSKYKLTYGTVGQFTILPVIIKTSSSTFILMVGDDPLFFSNKISSIDSFIKNITKDKLIVSDFKNNKKNWKILLMITLFILVIFIIKNLDNFLVASN